LYRSLFREELECILGGTIEKGKGKKNRKEAYIAEPRGGGRGRT
jgi:hypothetical protein